MGTRMGPWDIACPSNGNTGDWLFENLGQEWDHGTLPIPRLGWGKECDRRTLSVPVMGHFLFQHWGQEWDYGTLPVPAMGRRMGPWDIACSSIGDKNEAMGTLPVPQLGQEGDRGTAMGQGWADWVTLESNL
ncbi:hypothetical protein CBR_g45298 [Chara braunii]|uniref:Uncharacterized protein n=1 Tax=Chara braunii TaxID=69332 RepID=A0A388LYF6_CHABU|nr:hypothetical protein CBR_g45298 [Chara braunii]|eukprot:GBG87239.1 hypothetical protein CBR_g45298 [Chara braunii]